MKYLITLIAFAACTSLPVVEVKEPVVVPEVSASEYRADWPQKVYTDILVKALNEHGKELLAAKPKDLADFCASSDKVQCWVGIISSVSRYESNFKADKVYPEKFDVDGKKCAVTGKPCVLSTGLLQISIASANGNYGCGFKNQAEIKDPEKHLPCVVKMIQKLVVQNGVISAPGPKGMGRYWSVLQYGNQYQKIDAVKKRAKELSGG